MIELVFGGSGALLVLLGLPLMMRKIGPNSLYGVRTPATLRSKTVWYDTNAMSGKYFSVAGALTLLVALSMRHIPMGGLKEKGLFTMAVFAGSALVSAILSLRVARRLSRGGSTQD